MCGDVGGGAYDTRLVAESFVAKLLTLPRRYAPDVPAIIRKRYGIDLFAEEYKEDPDNWLDDLADRRFGGDITVASSVLLADFRNGKIGKIALEAPPGIYIPGGEKETPKLPEGIIKNIDELTNEPPPLPDPDLRRRVQQCDFDGW